MWIDKKWLKNDREIGGRTGTVCLPYVLPCGALLIRLRLNAINQEGKPVPSRLPTIKMYITAEEHEEITAKARRAGLSYSAYVKRVCLGMPTPSLEKQQYRRELLKINADLGRLGGLFKLCLSEKETPLQSLHTQLRNVLREIEVRQREMKNIISKI